MYSKGVFEKIQKLVCQTDNYLFAASKSAFTLMVFCSPIVYITPFVSTSMLSLATLVIVVGIVPVYVGLCFNLCFKKVVIDQ